MANQNVFKCCICGKLCVGDGHNPFPIKEEGRCCSECHYKKVVPQLLHRQRWDCFVWLCDI